MKKVMKKVLATALTAAMVLSMASCGGKGGDNTSTPGGSTADNSSASETSLNGTYDITVWVSETEGVKELTESQIKAFCDANPGIVINATVEGVSEADSATQMITSVEDGADIFCFAQDQLARLVMAGAVNKLGQSAAATVRELNDAGAVGAASVGGELYCYPMTSDNGYFMFYDKDVVKEEHLDSLEDVIADCEAAGKMFSMELETSAWYNVSFLFATGCVSNWTTNTDGDFTSVDDTFNSDAGVIALKGMQKLLKSKAYNSSSNGADFAAAVPSAVVVTGTWAINAINDSGVNWGATDLPSFTVDGKSYHMASYSGNKLMGVKPQTDAVKGAVLQKLALYLTGEECQTQRFAQFGWGPSNLKAQATDAVQNDPALSALAAQNNYATPQCQIHGSWWDIAKLYAVSAKTATTDAELKAALQTYEDTIQGLFTMSDEAKSAMSVIGALCGTNWDTDFPMEKDGNTYTTAPLELKAGDELKVRQGASWDVNFGGDGNLNGPNLVVEADGTYVVTLVWDGTSSTAELSIVAK